MKNTLNPRAKRGVVLTTIIVVAFGLGWLFRSTPEQATTKASQEAKVELVSNAPNATNSGLKDDFFKVAPLGENPYGNLIQPSLAGVGVDEETQTGSLKQITEKQLEATAKNPAALVGTTHALLPDREIPKELTVEINGEKYLSEEAQILWAELSTVIINNYKDKTIKTVDSIPAKGYTDGMDQNGNYIVSADERDFTGKNGVQWTNNKGQVVYSDADCANWVFTTIPKGVKRGTIPPRNITPKNPTPPSITVSPKNIGEAPQNNPAVVANDPQNIRPAANGPEEATINTSPGTAYQGTPADVAAQQQQAAAAAAAAAQQQAAAAAAAAQQHQQAQQAAAAALAQQQQQAAAAAQQAQNAQQQQAAQQQQQQVNNQQQAQQQNNQGTVTGGNGW